MPLALLHAILLQQSYYGRHSFVHHHSWTLADLATLVNVFSSLNGCTADTGAVADLAAWVYTRHCKVFISIIIIFTNSQDEWSGLFCFTFISFHLVIVLFYFLFPTTWSYLWFSGWRGLHDSVLGLDKLDILKAVDKFSGDKDLEWEDNPTYTEWRKWRWARWRKNKLPLWMESEPTYNQYTTESYLLEQVVEQIRECPDYSDTTSWDKLISHSLTMT